MPAKFYVKVRGRRLRESYRGDVAGAVAHTDVTLTLAVIFIFA